MIPQEDTSDYLFKNGRVVEGDMPSLTYKMHIYDKEVNGNAEGIKALEQAIYKELNTERYDYPIYEEYGIQLKDLFGKPKNFVYPILCERIRECLENDDRINSVVNFKYIKEESRYENLSISFVVNSIYGEIPMKEVFKA